MIHAACLAYVDLDDEEIAWTFARNISTLIYEMSHIPSGYISDARILECQTKGGLPQHTKEHFMGRHNGGVAVTRYVIDCRADQRIPSIAVIQKIIDRYRVTHYTTSKENTELGSKAKANPLLTPPELYELCGIKLQRVIPHQRYSKYQVGDDVPPELRPAPGLWFQA